MNLIATEAMWRAQIIMAMQNECVRFLEDARRVMRNRRDLVEIWNLRPRNC